MVFWPDMFHRFARRTAAALSSSDGTDLLRKLNKLFKFSRGPYNTSKHGKVMESHRGHLIAALKSGAANELCDMWMAGVARDVGKDLADSVSDLIAELERKKGRWF